MQAGVKKKISGAIKAKPFRVDTAALIRQSGLPAPEQQFTGSLLGIEPVTREGGLRQVLDKDLGAYNSLIETFEPGEQARLLQTGLTHTRSLLNQAEANASILGRMNKNRVKFIYDLHMKYVFAAMSVVFLFIGAPMGAIVRKGGFGFPILIATIFFVLFIILSIFCRKIAEAFVVTGQLAAWIPCIVYIPLGLYLSIKAMNDSEIMRFEAVQSLIRRFIRPKAAS